MTKLEKPTSKICTTCKIEKPFSAYSPLAMGKWGFAPRCRFCANEYQKARQPAYDANKRAARIADQTRIKSICLDVALYRQFLGSKIQCQTVMTYDC